MAAVIPAACGATSSGFSPVYYLLFQLSLTVLCTIGQWSILSLDDGSPFLNWITAMELRGGRVV